MGTPGAVFHYAPAVGRSLSVPGCRWLVALGAALVFSREGHAHAFEKQWHLGIGGGVMVPSAEYRAGGAASLHAAYGISDVFDVRLTAAGSILHLLPDGGGRTSLSLGTLGLAYKVDVIEWVPYCGARAGFYAFGTGIGEYSKNGASLGGMCGVDYSFARSAAVGVEVSEDFLLPHGAVFGALLHAEYRWGF